MDNNSHSFNIRSLWDGDSYSYLVFVDGEHVSSFWTYDDAENEVELMKSNESYLHHILSFSSKAR